MPTTCEVQECHKPVGLFLGGHGLCTSHGDEVIDWALQSGLRVSALTGAQITEFLTKHADSQMPPKAKHV